MSRSRISAALAGAVALGTLSAVPLAGIASAEPTFGPQADDIVGVGSDTTQFAMDYLADGATVGGQAVPGYDTGRTTARLVTFDAIGAGLSTTITPKQGATAITRPNGSGAGKGLLYGTGNNPSINFARSSSALNGAEIGGNLQAVPFAVDGLKLAVSATATHAPAAVSPADMVKIYDGTYDQWSDIPGAPAGTSTALIHPLIPQPSSGTRTFFEAQLKAANGGTPVAYGSGVAETQEHSDTDIKGDPDAIAPFSTGRGKTTTTVKLLGGFSAQRALYNVVRNTDLNATWFAPIFGEAGFICSTAAKPLIEHAGFEQLATAADGGGVCGQPTQGATSNFATSTHVVQGTTTIVTSAVSNQSVRLTATVRGVTNAAAGTGTLQFFEGATALGSPQTLAGGTALLNLPGVSIGAHSYRAEYTSDVPDFFDSSSAPKAMMVAKSASRTTLVMPSKFRKTVRAKAKIAVSTAGHAASGLVTVKKGTRQIAQKALAAGSTTFTLPRFATGRYTLTFTYRGNATTLSSKAVKRITVTR